MGMHRNALGSVGSVLVRGLRMRRVRQFERASGWSDVCRVCRLAITDGSIAVHTVIYGKKVTKHLQCWEPAEVE